jgi:hypothetical protein
VCQDIWGYFSFGVQGSLNKIEKYVKFDPTGSGFDSRGMKLSNPGDLMYYGVDASVKYSMNLINSKVMILLYMLVEVILFLETVATGH